MSSTSPRFSSDIAWLDTLASAVPSEPEVAPGQEEAQLIYPLLPLEDQVIFPRTVTALVLGRTPALQAVEEAMADDGHLVAFTQRDPLDEEPVREDLFDIGTEIKVSRLLHMPDGSTSILAQGRQRVRLVELIDDGPFPQAVVTPLWDSAVDETATAEALMRAVLTLFERCVDLSPQLPDEAYVVAINAGEPGWLADIIASTLQVDAAVKQEILEASEPVERMQRISVLLANELDVLELEARIHAQVHDEVDKSQREYFLREQMRVIQRELGETDEQSREVSLLRTRLEAARLPPRALERAEEELGRLAIMPPFAPELSMVRTYIDWLLGLPWSQTTDDHIDIGRAERVLAGNHYGLPKAKERILEHIAVRKLAGDKMRAPVLCFVGAPGTGKTSIGRSVAQALRRRFVRISLGGVRDEAEVRGHRRTYVGAMPGRILQAMRTAASRNPVFMLDEIDKLGVDFRGDPAAALLEVLDPEQHREFTDHYLEVPFDLSQVLFITTANRLDTIPEPLLDRLEVIRFPGYIEDEKVHIAQQFLVPRQIEETGLVGHGLAFSEQALRATIRDYTYEAGLRNLERSVASICRKVARRVAEGKRAPRRITATMLPKFLGPPLFTSSSAKPAPEVGVATGLAWTEGGGDLVEVEVTLMPGKGSLILTGQLGEIMQESGQAALSYARSQAARLAIEAINFDELDIHIHLPEGAIPKDGPSAGITMATALVSALTNRPVRNDVAMTGEVTLRGRVLAVGGLKEKAVAAHRAGLKTVLIPRQNERDLTELPPRIRRDLAFVPVATMSEVLEQALVVQQEVES